MILFDHYTQAKLTNEVSAQLKNNHTHIHINGMTGSLNAVIGAALSKLQCESSQLFIASNKEEALYLLNDLEILLQESDFEIDKKQVLFFPSTYRKPYQATEETDNANVLQRAAVVKQLNAGRRLLVVTYPEALSEKVLSAKTLTRNTLQIIKGTRLSMDFIIDVMQEYGFEHVDFVVEPGQYALRGGIIDVFSFANENPFRIEFFDDEIESLRTFDPVSQLSIKQLDKITILPNIEQHHDAVVHVDEKVPLLNYFSGNDIVWVQGLTLVCETIEKGFDIAKNEHAKINSPIQHLKPEELYCSVNEFFAALINCKIIEHGNSHYFNNAINLSTSSEPQPHINKQFDMLINTLNEYRDRGYTIYITVGNDSQLRRLEKIFQEMPDFNIADTATLEVTPSLHHGFIDHAEKIICFTDHEIFDRYHKYTVRNLQETHEALTIKELFELKPGDFVTHIDYGVGRFSGLEKVTHNGKTQEVIRLIYKNNDTLYISIHGLHKISRYVGKEGIPPTLNRLGSNTWQVLKQRTKKQVKDIAKDLIALYAKRKASKGFAFNADTYMQNELEASFFYEDTPDQNKATRDVKRDMEMSAPMDRLICGDVGFGKTEVAIRAAFKACCDSKQVAVLVPNTILAFQHYNTFSSRLKGMPVRVDYLNRFRSTKEKNQIIKDLAEGRIDILIGTHAINNSKIKFKDLGLLIIDEEQKFGVSAKEKLRQMKVNVDCLTLTATPIPRTLQFSLMGARDLSVIQTPPPNRQPIQTELVDFNEETIRDAITFEMSRGGQTFFVSNRIENLAEMAGLVQRLVPDARVAVAHGQMDGKKVEDTLMRFLEGDLDVLVATSIVENGLDIPNANTMIINNAQNFGLSDLHQMRGRVGRNNQKAFCYLLVPSYSVLTDEAQKRLKAIEEFSTIGSGFNIAMRDLDIRGAGNILGAEQSGFISEIGYDMYHKILNEAIEELKESDFKELFQQELEENKEYVKECMIETDLEVLLPDDYVSSISERLLLYKELNDTRSEEDLDQYRLRLTDRFGPIPDSTEELIRTITLRRMAKELGIEKVILKQDKMVCHFVTNQSSPFYSSDNFMKMIRYAQNHAHRIHLKESTERLSMVCDNIKSISSAIGIIQGIVQCDQA